jgi:hypothetical protein
MMAINAEWHNHNKMPKNATFEQRVAWHLAHEQHCTCRPIPDKLREEMEKKGFRQEEKSGEAVH